MKKLLNLILSLLMVVGLTTNVHAEGGSSPGWGGFVGTVYKVKDVNETDQQSFAKDGIFSISMQGLSPEEQLAELQNRLNNYLDAGYIFADENEKVPETLEEKYIFDLKYGLSSQQNMPEYPDEQTIKLKHNTLEEIIEQPSGVTHYKTRRIEHIFVGEENKNYNYGQSGLHTYTEYAIKDAVTLKTLEKVKRDIQVQFPSYKPPVVDGWQADKTEIEAQTYYDYNYPRETITYTKTGTPEKTFKTYISAYDLVADGSQETVNLRIYQLKDNNYTYLQDITDDQWELIETTTLTFDSPTEPTSGNSYSFDVTVPQTNLTGNRYKIEADLAQPSSFVVTEGGSHSCSFDIGAYSNGVCKGGDGDFYIFLERQKPVVPTYDLTVRKQVNGNLSGEDFMFVLDVYKDVETEDGEVVREYYPIWNDSDYYDILHIDADGNMYFVLKADESVTFSIAEGYEYNVRELPYGDKKYEDYAKEGIVNPQSKEWELSDTSTTTDSDGNVEMTFINEAKDYTPIELSTYAINNVLGNKYIDIDSLEVKDTVTYSGLTPNTKYKLKTGLLRRGISSITGSEYVSNHLSPYLDNIYTEFTSSGTGSGSVDVVVDFTDHLYIHALYDDCTYIVTQKLYDENNVELYSHEDAYDEDQSLYTLPYSGSFYKYWQVRVEDVEQITEPFVSYFEISVPEGTDLGEYNTLYYKYETLDSEDNMNDTLPVSDVPLPKGIQTYKFVDNKVVIPVFTDGHYFPYASTDKFEFLSVIIDIYGMNPDVEYTIKELEDNDWITSVYHPSFYETRDDYRNARLISYRDGVFDNDRNEVSVTLSDNEGGVFELYSFVNQYKPLKDIKITKEWIDTDESLRPDAIAIKLLKDGEEIWFGTLRKQDDYSITFKKCPVLDKDGKEIEYTIQELYAGEGYQLKEIKETDEGFALVNEYKPKKTTITLTKELVGKSDKDKFGIYILPFTDNFNHGQYMKFRTWYPNDTRASAVGYIAAFLDDLQEYDKTADIKLYPAYSKLFDQDFINEMKEKVANASIDNSNPTDVGIFTEEEMRKLDSMCAYYFGWYDMSEMTRDLYNMDPDFYINYGVDNFATDLNTYAHGGLYVFGDILAGYVSPSGLDYDDLQDYVNKTILNNKLFYYEISAGETKTIELPNEVVHLIIIEEDSEGITEFEPIYYGDADATRRDTPIYGDSQPKTEFEYHLVNRGTFTPEITNTTVKVGESTATAEKEAIYELGAKEDGVELSDTVEYEGLDDRLTYTIKSTIYSDDKEVQTKLTEVKNQNKGSLIVAFDEKVQEGIYDVKTEVLLDNNVVFTHNEKLDTKLERATITRKKEYVNTQVTKVWKDDAGEDIEWPVDEIKVLVEYSSESEELTLTKDTSTLTTKDFEKVEDAEFKVTELTELEDFTTKVEKTEEGYVITNAKKPTQDIGEPPVAYTEIEVVKYAEDTKQPLKGAEITLFDENDEVVLEVYSDKPSVALTGENGKVTFYVDSYKYKTVYVKETKAPEGYLINEEKFNIELIEGENRIENTSIDIYDKPIKPEKTIINVEVVKYAEDTKLPLKDAEITIFTEDDEVVLDINGNGCIALTDENGKAVFQIYKEDYPSVYVQETKAPEGYRINENKFDLDTSVEIINVSVDIYDVPIAPDEPSEESKPTETPVPTETPKPSEKPTKPTITPKPDMPEKPNIIKETPKPQVKTIVKTVPDTGDNTNMLLYGIMFISSLAVMLFTSLKLIKNK